jgi:hypothetical protein
MLRGYYAVELRTARRTRIRALLVHAGVAAMVGLASAVSGAAVALHLAAPPPGQYLSRSGGAATPAAIAAAPVEKPMIVADALSPTAQARIAASPDISDASAANRAVSAAPPASPLSERELTFAWGYAQRHPGVQVRQAEARVAPPVASAGSRAAPAAKRDSRRPAQRQRPSVAQRETVALASSGFFPGYGGDRRQALGYTEERGANGLGVSSRAQFSAQRATTTLPSLRNHEPRS